MAGMSALEMQILDENCEYFGLSRLALMENAGAAVAREIEQRFKGGKVAIFCGTGNNGGDGFVAARHLSGKFDVEVFLLGRESEIRTEEARRNYRILKNCGVKIREIRDSRELRDIECDLIVDAMLGTGVKGKVSEPISTAISIINRLRVPVISVDIPSGMDPDTGKGKHVNSSLVITFHRMKKGLAGREGVKVVPIGIPPGLEELVGPGDLRAALGRRDPESHKGDNGRVLVIGGGPYFGAPTLAAMAALRAGADLVTLAVPRSVSQTVSSFSPNLIVRELTSSALCPDDVEFVAELIKSHDVVAIGMGIGKGDETGRAVSEILKRCRKAVIDAEALGITPVPKDAILTPHAGEFERIAWKLKNPREDVKKYARKIGATVILKGPRDVISDGERTKINVSGNAGMTVGGTGDVLSGITAAFYAVNDDPFLSACAAAFCCGKAGDLALESKGFSLLATDVIDNIPEVLKRWAWWM